MYLHIYKYTCTCLCCCTQDYISCSAMPHNDCEKQLRHVEKCFLSLPSGPLGPRSGSPQAFQRVCWSAAALNDIGGRVRPPRERLGALSCSCALSRVGPMELGEGPASWAGAPPDDSADSGDTVGMFFIPTLAGMVAREQELDVAAAEARWNLFHLGVLGRDAQIRCEAVETSPLRLDAQLRAICRLAGRLRQCRSWTDAASLPAVLQLVQGWTERMHERTITELLLARRLRNAFVGYLRQDVQGRRADWLLARTHLRAVRTTRRRLRRAIRRRRLIDSTAGASEGSLGSTVPGAGWN